MTPFTPPALIHYRQSHRIEVVKDWFDDWKHFDTVCRHDAIRVHPVRGGWRHDEAEVQRLVALERGEGRL